MSWQGDVLAAMQEIAAAIVNDKMVVDVGAAVVNVDLATVDVDAIVDGIAGATPKTLFQVEATIASTNTKLDTIDGVLDNIYSQMATDNAVFDAIDTVLDNIYSQAQSDSSKLDTIDGVLDNIYSQAQSNGSYLANIDSALYSGNGYALQDYLHEYNGYEPFYYNSQSIAYTLYNIESYLSTLAGTVSGGRVLTTPDNW